MLIKSLGRIIFRIFAIKIVRIIPNNPPIIIEDMANMYLDRTISFLLWEEII